MEEEENGGAYDSLIRYPTIVSALSLPHHAIFPQSSSSDGGDDDDDAASSYQYQYPKPVMLLDLVWNLAFVVASAAVQLSALSERPSTPLRVWIAGYAILCLLHVAFVFFEYRRRRRRGRRMAADRHDHDRAAVDELSHTDGHGQFYFIIKRLESNNTMASSIWWIIGFYWIVVGGRALQQDSPRLYWLTVIFLAFDVFFIIFCIGMACTVLLAVFCCIPILAVAYAVGISQGASEDDIRSLPKYRYRQDSALGNNDTKQYVLRATVGSSNSNSVDELTLLPEDSECCICLAKYVDGVELSTLPCNHHFHCGCISRWLRINATCPLCKFNIRSADTLV